MNKKHCLGVTLLELTLAVAIFAVTMGVAAQGLVSFYVTLDMQNQRVIALNHCQSILSEMRNLRDLNPNTPDNPYQFQTAVLERFADGWEAVGPAQLRNAIASVTYEDANPTANPLVPTVQVQWLDLRGHAMTQRLSSAITDR